MDRKYDYKNDYNKSALDVFKKVVSEELINKMKENEIRYSYEQAWETMLSRLGFLRKILRRFLPDNITNNITRAINFYSSLKYKKNYWQVSPLEKRLSLDFLNYVLKNNPDIPYDYFPREDWEEINRFVRNKFLISISDSISQEKLFSKKCPQRQKYYKDFLRKHRIKEKINYYEFLGFKSIVHSFEPSIFIEKYGIEYFENKTNIFNSTIIDCGAFVGDSAHIFNKELKPKNIIALEPDKINYHNLLKNIELNKWRNVIPVNKGVGEKIENLKVNIPGGVSSYLSNTGGEEIQVTTIDNLVTQFNISKIGLIKMDIEGYELFALKGAEQTIKKFKPSLLICLYHTGRDFFEIPAFLKKINPDYKFRFLNIDCMWPVTERILLAENQHSCINSE